MKRRGFALVAVLWALVVAGGLVITLLAAARTERRIAANARAASKSRWAARAALAGALEALDRTLSRYDAGLTLSGAGDTVLRPVEVRLDGIAGRAVTLDARARVNLNVAEGRELRSLLEALGVEPSRAVALADAILDFRDADALRRPYGAETAEYAAARSPVRPKDAPYDAVDELRDVLGMTGELYARMAPYVGVEGDGRVNVNSAAVPVLVTLPGVDQETAAAIVANRARGPYRNPSQLLAALRDPARQRIQANLAGFLERVALGPRQVDIVATAQSDASPVAAQLRAVVHLTGGGGWTLERVIDR